MQEMTLAQTSVCTLLVGYFGLKSLQPVPVMRWLLGVERTFRRAFSQRERERPPHPFVPLPPGNDRLRGSGFFLDPVK
jgi:hypothetical protein